MCWYSADHAERILQAEAGQRLVTRRVHGHNWAVPESDQYEQRPTPVCLLDQTKVLLRCSERQQITPDGVQEAEGVFRMLTHPKRDVVQLSGGREISFDSLPENLAFDILEVPGKEELSAVLKPDREHVDVWETVSRRS
jgi:hypothetical protein